MAKAKAKKTVKKPAKKAAKKSSCKEMEPLVVASKVKAYVKSKGMMSSSEVIAALSCKVYCMLDQAMCRTKENRRSTVKAIDL